MRRAEPRDGSPRVLEAAYARALRRYLSGGGEEALRAAYEIGRAAMAQGGGLLELSEMHHAALGAALALDGTGASAAAGVDRARELFGECLATYEMTRRGFHDAISALRRLNETLEAEIQRIAHGVHDEAGQLLEAVRLALTDVARDAGPPLRGRIRDAGRMLDQAEEGLRRISHELRPLILDDLGLEPALRLLASGVSGRSRMAVTVRSSLAERPRPNVETALYRIVQEALANAVRHAQARRVEIRLSRAARGLQCLIRDDGVGFDARAVLSGKLRHGLGLVGIRERLDALGGTLQVRSRPGRGTQLVARIPAEA
ncbi:MAG TPA: ATP-binding protein [Anaeromyxobacteraceae bacterium]